MKTYEPMAGERIEDTTRKIVVMAGNHKEAVQAKFNEVILTANPGDKSEDIAACYMAELKRRHDEYVSSLEYKEACRKAEEEQRAKDLLLQGALSMAPEKMTFRDEALWLECAEKNKDAYGAAVMSFADRWARIMETRVSNGETVESCADEICSLADTEGITGFMYGCAVSILSRVWAHGDALRRWHNLKTQVGSEGERANESGGVLNPAILTIG